MLRRREYDVNSSASVMCKRCVSTPRLALVKSASVKATPWASRRSPNGVSLALVAHLCQEFHTAPPMSAP
eukprot:11190433-Heterocapsa_arctica.AAC.1